jgi:hypothetical protein
VLLPPAPQAFSKVRHAKRTPIRANTRTGFNRRTLVTLPSAIANVKAMMGVGHCGTRENGPPIVTAAARARAVVVTVTLNGAALAAFTVAGDTVQVACVGAPLHVNVTEPVNPPDGFT